MSNLKLAGKFLIASPKMTDSSFSKTVIFVAGYVSDRGAIGMVVNSPGTVSMSEVFRQLDINSPDMSKIEQELVGWGGPVQESHGYILHSREDDRQWDVTIFSGKDISVTVSPDIVYEIAKGNGPERCYIVLGCAAWAPGQLEDELAREDWLVADADPKVVFSLPLDQRYDAALALVGLEDRSEVEKSLAFTNFSQVGHA